LIGACLTLAALLTLPATRAQEKVPPPPIITKPVEKQIEGKDKKVDDKKTEAKKADLEKADEKKVEPVKTEEKKTEPTQAEEKKADSTKAEGKKVEPSKVEEKKDPEKKEKTVDEKIGDVATVANDAKTAAGDAKVLGDSAWLLVSTAFVMLMVPGLALFYGGMVRRKNVLATMMQSMICLSVVGVFWIGIGYSLAFGDPWLLGPGGASLLGWSPELVFLRGVTPSSMVPNLNIPVYLHMAYQGMFAIITPALISGAIAERIRFKPYLIFVLLWMVVVYCPLAQNVWAMNWNWGHTLMAESNGAQLSETAEKTKTEADAKSDDAQAKKAAEEAAAKLDASNKTLEARKAAYVKAKMDAVSDPEAKKKVESGYSNDAGKRMTGYLGVMGALDFAGGTVVHIAAGLSSLACFLVLRKRYGYPEKAFHPNSMVLCLTGAGLLWFGWFGFNGGSALASGTLAVSAFAATQAAAAGAALSWSLVEWLHRGKPTALGFASGVVAGLVAVTPAAGYVVPWAGLVIGLLAGVICYFSVFLKSIFQYDDSLDAFGVHGVGGFLGAVLTGVFCWWPVNKAAIGNQGFFYATDDRMAQVIIQLKAAVFSVVLAFVGSLVLVKLVDLLFGFTVTEDEEVTGLDRVEHGETGFDLGLALEAVGATIVLEPKAAVRPPNGVKHYAVVIEGASGEELSKAWSELCLPGAGSSADFKAIYPNLTTFQGNRFRFRGGDANAIKESLKRLFDARLKKPVNAKVE